MRIRNVLMLAVAAVSLLALAVPANAVPSLTVVINEVQTRGDAGALDEFVEIQNVGTSPVDINGWRMLGCNSTGSIVTRVVIGDEVQEPPLQPGESFLMVNRNAYNGPVLGDDSYSTGITDDGGVRLQNAVSSIIDQVGFSATTPCLETAPTANDAANADNSVTRSEVAGLTVDSDVNAADFTAEQPSTPENRQS